MSRKILFDPNAWDDYQWWQVNDRAVLRKLNRLIDDTARNGNADGIGKPEPLRNNLSGWWSRRVTDEHRMVYRCTDEVVEILACRFRYDN
ncbi:Txe/YoeB family addiction module toxin [Nocardia sp. IFM 10818]